MTSRLERLRIRRALRHEPTLSVAGGVAMSVVFIASSASVESLSDASDLTRLVLTLAVAGGLILGGWLVERGWAHRSGRGLLFAKDPDWPNNAATKLAVFDSLSTTQYWLRYAIWPLCPLPIIIHMHSANRAFWDIRGGDWESLAINVGFVAVFTYCISGTQRLQHRSIFLRAIEASDPAALPKGPQLAWYRRPPRP